MPKHQTIYNDLLQQIHSGQRPPGSQLPTEKELCSHYSVSRITVMRAVNDLVNAGIVKRTAGKGTFVKEKAESRIPIFHIILPDLGRHYYSKMANSFSKFLCQKNAIGSILVAPGYNTEYTSTLLNNLDISKINGIAIIPSGTRDKGQELLSILSSCKVPIIIGSRELEGFGGKQLIVDEEKAGIRAVEHLVAQGHSKLAYVGPTGNYLSSHLRYKGFCEACHRNYLKPVHVFEHTDIIAYRELRDIFSKPERSPTAVVTADESRAMFILEILTSLNINCPKDIAIIALDGTEMSPSLEVPLTAIEFPGIELGREMARELWEQSKQPLVKPVPEVKKYSSDLIIRSSCGAQPARYRHEYLRSQLPT